MPLLTLLGGAAALAAGVLGVGGHLDAQDKNEEAEKTRQMAQSYYDAAKDLLDLVIRVAGGEQTKAEKHGFREISIFKDGVVL